VARSVALDSRFRGNVEHKASCRAHRRCWRVKARTPAFMAPLSWEQVHAPFGEPQLALGSSVPGPNEFELLPPELYLPAAHGIILEVADGDFPTERQRLGRSGCRL